MEPQTKTSAANFDHDYYERGVETRLSGYTNYHWRPEYVLPMANLIRQKFGQRTTLDFGCAKGFLVKALRMLGVRAFGYDISRYAIKNCDPAVQGFVWDQFPAPGPNLFGTIIAKDVLEHVAENRLPEELARIHGLCCPRAQVLVVVPLGDNNLYRIREYELDVTHRIRQDEVWWINAFKTAGFEVQEFHYALPGIKEHWTRQYPTGNGIFILGNR